MRIPRATERTGPLEGHVRKGRKFKSPLSATDALQIGDWFKDDAPDLIWPILLVSSNGPSSIRRMIKWQKAVQGDLKGLTGSSFISDCLDGRLSSLERLAKAYPEAILACKARAQEYDLLPTNIVNTLAAYPNLPAPWLVSDTKSEFDETSAQLIADALINILGNGHHHALVKCLGIWSRVQAGTFSAAPDVIDILSKYPVDPETRDQADSIVRAFWGAERGLVSMDDPERLSAAAAWAYDFWRTNSMTTDCIRRERKRPDEDTPIQTRGAQSAPDDSGEPNLTPSDDSPATTMPPEGAHLRRLVMDLFSSYVEAVENSPSDLHNYQQQEVHSGLVARAARDLIAVLASPDLWCAEHGAHITRMLIEVRIYLKWMALQEPTIYKTFRDYGAGKAKLYGHILSENVDLMQNAAYRESVDHFFQLSHNDDVVDHRDVDTGDSFSGKSIRTMASECGLLDLYRRAYGPASGISHSEWWSVESHAMTPCMNITHGGHLIPSFTLSQGANMAIANAWIDSFMVVLRESLQAVGAEQSAVNASFAWLEEGEATD